MLIFNVGQWSEVSERSEVKEVNKLLVYRELGPRRDTHAVGYHFNSQNKS